MPTTVITGASRGLGLELARQYAADGWRVFACARNPQAAQELDELAEASDGRLTVHPLDVADHAQIAALARQIDGAPIDLLLNCAGVMGSATGSDNGMSAQRFGRTDYDEWTRTLRVNTFGPLKMAETFVDNVAASTQKKIVALTSITGSMGQNTFGGLYPYRSSKAALNAVLKSMALDLKRRGIIVLPLHPGWVRTAIGGSRGELDVVESVVAMRQLIAALQPTDSGRFLQWDGRELPW